MSKRNILITGVSRGLGLAMAAELIGQGHIVWGCARDEAALAALRKRWPAPHDFATVDVSRDADVAAWAERAGVQEFVPDLMINNAALVNQNARLWEISAAEFDRLLAVNVSGVTNVIRNFLPPMLARGKGVIVNFSSGWGRSVSAEVAPYCATKWAIEGLTQALAEELPKGMAAVPLNPGIIDTDMLRSCFGAEAANYPSPSQWAARAVPFILKLGPADNGEPLTVPG
ncbi:MAG TPA: SDR family oxidoreductase [Pirellulales bacterium]|jgi:NAD(P)-dependent dehydrogenase (short-subunit alcohol dehydrogenase family)|nr:SDR family oxidoreductase [Pirellulales bacterium]